MHAELLKVTLYSCKWLAISCSITTQKCNIVQCGVQLTCVHVKITWQCKSTSSAGADLGGGCRGCAPPPEMTCGFLIQLVFCKKKLCDLLEETSAPPPKKNPGSTPEV